MACAAALRGGFYTPDIRTPNGGTRIMRRFAAPQPRIHATSLPPNACRWETSLTHYPFPSLPSSIHFVCPDVEVLERSDHPALTSILFLPIPRVTAFSVGERAGGVGGPYPGHSLTPLALRHLADRHSTFRNMPLPFCVELSSCSTGSRTIGFPLFPFRRPSCCRHPTPLLLLGRSCKAERDVDRV